MTVYVASGVSYVVPIDRWDFVCVESASCSAKKKHTQANQRSQFKVGYNQKNGN